MCFQVRLCLQFSWQLGFWTRQILWQKFKSKTKCLYSAFQEFSYSTILLKSRMIWARISTIPFILVLLMINFGILWYNIQLGVQDLILSAFWDIGKLYFFMRKTWISSLPILLNKIFIAFKTTESILQKHPSKGMFYVFLWANNATKHLIFTTDIQADVIPPQHAPFLPQTQTHYLPNLNLAGCALNPIA